MSGFKVGDSGLYQSLWVDGALDSSLGWEAEDKGFGNDCLAVLQMAKDFFHGDLALFALWEHAGQVIVLDNQGRAWCTQKGSEIEHELGSLLGLAGNNCHSVNPETPSFKQLLGYGEEIESCLLKQVPGEDGKQGLFLVVSKQRNFFAPREYQLLGIFAANLGFARCNRLLSTRADRLSQAFAALEDIGTAIARTNDFEEVLGLVLQKLEQLTGAESGGVLLYDGEKQELVLQRPAFGAQNEDAALYRLSVRQDRPSEGLAVEVFLRRKPYICNDAPADKKSNQQYIKLFGIRNFVTIPLVMENRGIGVLHLVNKRQGYFTEQDVQLLSILASELAVLIENARLINQTKQQHDRLSRSVSIHKEFTQMVLEGRGLKSIARTLAQIVDCQVEVT
ncbi:MAG: GAF domain-containing protein, partial [Clostridia bacterium]|nr:GAF domain-containing protein [Clostridia bacterium]